MTKIIENEIELFATQTVFKQAEMIANELVET